MTFPVEFNSIFVSTGASIFTTFSESLLPLVRVPLCPVTFDTPCAPVFEQELLDYISTVTDMVSTLEFPEEVVHILKAYLSNFSDY
jgi:hypothetical protein